MRLFRDYLRGETARCVAQRRPARGHRPARPARTHLLRSAIEDAERATARRHPAPASHRDSTTRRATPSCAPPSASAATPCPSRESFGRLLAIVDHGTPVPELDLLIRTGGERRLSDFLLWEAAYAELLFTDAMWPEFGADGLQRRRARLRGRERRFGGLPGAAAG